MTFIRYKTFGKQEYAYEITSYRDKKTTRPKQKTKYLGVVVDKEKEVFKKPLKEKLMKEKIILDFGDTFLIHKFLEKEGFTKLLKNSFGKNANMLFNLIAYRLCHPSAMRLNSMIAFFPNESFSIFMKPSASINFWRKNVSPKSTTSSSFRILSFIVF